MSWITQARQRHAAAQRALAASLPSYQVPIGDSDYTAPGYLYYGHFYSCIPDPCYPWDRNVLAAIRSFCPDAMPILIRSVWRFGGYGQMDDFFTITRHGLARSIRNPILPVHSFHCEMPSTPVRGLAIPGRHIHDCRPNYIELEWHDKDDRPWGFDLPGTYLPFDWEFHNALRRCYDEDSGITVHAVVDQHRENRLRRAASRREEESYRMRDFRRYYSVEPSDVEWKQAVMGTKETPTRPSIAVP